jgi:phage terminase large subunit-like protein
MSIAGRDVSSLSDFEVAVIHGIITENIVLTETEAEVLATDWGLHARPSQRVPMSMGALYRIWMIRAGRGFGKTRTGGETARAMSERTSRIALVAPTRAEVRDIMVEGQSGILSAFPSWDRPTYEPTRRRVVFPSGCLGFMYSAQDPDRLRGPEHGWAWIDEPASMRGGGDMMSNLLLGLRMVLNDGGEPWALMTGTPKMLPWMRKLDESESTLTTRGSTYENISNLAPSFIVDVIDRYEGTRLGRQELHGEFLDDVEGALWTMDVMNDNRIPGKFDVLNAWEMLASWLHEKGRPAVASAGRAWRTIVAVDPPGETAECGIVVGSAPVNGRGGRDHAIVQADYSMAGRPEEWGAQVVKAYRETGAQAVYVEANQGGDMTRSTIHAVDNTVPVRKVTARVSKKARAEPVSALYERGYVHHVGFMPELEDQQVTWVPDSGKSPDRLDALVHLIRELLPSVPLSSVRTASPVGRSI